jgi:hypothetical protein
MRKLDVATPHFTDRIDQAQQLVASRDDTPALADADRELLGDTLRDLGQRIGERRGAEQLLHGELHPGNVLTTKNGLLFIDLETCCRGPVEFDLAHAPEEVSDHYPGINPGLLRQCRMLVLAMITNVALGPRRPTPQRAPARHRMAQPDPSSASGRPLASRGITTPATLPRQQRAW